MHSGDDLLVYLGDINGFIVGMLMDMMVFMEGIV